MMPFANKKGKPKIRFAEIAHDKTDTVKSAVT